MPPHTLKLTIAWLALCLITLLSVAATHLDSPLGFAPMVLGIAFLKVFLVMQFFIELPLAARRYRLAYGGWVVLVCLVLMFMA